MEVPFPLAVVVGFQGVPTDGCKQLTPDAMVYHNSWFLESRATSLDMAEAFWPRRHLPRVEAFAKSALIAVSNTPELEKLGAWELVADAL